MKINGLELYQISIPFAEPYRLSKIYGTLHDAQAVIIKLKKYTVAMLEYNDDF